MKTITVLLLVLFPAGAWAQYSIEAGALLSRIDTGISTKTLAAPTISVSVPISKSRCHLLSISYQRYSWDDWKEWTPPPRTIIITDGFYGGSTHGNVRLEEYLFGYEYRLKAFRDDFRLFFSTKAGVGKTTESGTTIALGGIAGYYQGEYRHTSPWALALQGDTGVRWAVGKHWNATVGGGYMYRRNTSDYHALSGKISSVHLMLGFGYTF